MSALSVLPALRGPQWVAARQHRSTARVFTALILLCAVFVAAFLITLALSDDPASVSARGADTGLTLALNTSLVPLSLLPALVGAFVAGPLVARELESGTYTWLWTQSVTPVRWLATKLALTTAVTLTGTTALVLLFRAARDGLPEGSLRFSWYGTAYEMLGPGVVAQCALGIGVGALVGLLVRRTVPAMVVTAVVVFVAQSALTMGLRELLWPVRTLVSKTPIESLHTPQVWTLTEGMLTSDGTRILNDTCNGPTGVGSTFEECMTGLGGVTHFADVHPESHFWPLQLVGSGLLLALAAIAVALAFRVLRGRHAGAS
ncbi:ABC transporter permease [Streptomyces sp. NPDC087440]|uniref:ABC transporter permease n=1 Tax=Streptomyces sp. NPDC087440 TaxID=3365790 RepID=UPI0037FAC16B